MIGKPSISIILDRRRKLASGLWPVALQATFKKPSGGYNQKRYRIGVESSEKDFDQALGRKCPKQLTELRKRIMARQADAVKILDDHDYVGIDLFERLFLGAAGTGISGLFKVHMKQLEEFEQIGTRDAYKCALASFIHFADGAEPSFAEITVDWIKRYSKSMRARGRSVTTISMYLRCLRKIYNDAIEPFKIISADHYPFGKRRFKIQAVRKPKTALDQEMKNRVLNYQTVQWRKNVDFWILSYFDNGMNMTDIAYLKNKNVDDDFLIFERTKISNTTDTVKQIVIPLRPEVKVIIARWRGKAPEDPDDPEKSVSLDPDDYLFPILKEGMTAEERKYRIKDFIKEINGKRNKKTGKCTGLKAVAQELKFKFSFTTYTARHTFANISKKAGSSNEQIQEALGHEDPRTTRSYLESFDVETKKKMSEKL